MLFTLRDPLLDYEQAGDYGLSGIARVQMPYLSSRIPAHMHRRKMRVLRAGRHIFHSYARGSGKCLPDRVEKRSVEQLTYVRRSISASMYFIMSADPEPRIFLSPASSWARLISGLLSGPKANPCSFSREIRSSLRLAPTLFITRWKATAKGLAAALLTCPNLADLRGFAGVAAVNN